MTDASASNLFDSITVTEGPELCLQPSQLRNDGIARLKVLGEESMEGHRWGKCTLMHFNEKWNEMLPSCRVLFLNSCQGSLWCKRVLSWGRAWALQASCSCRSAGLGVLPIFLTLYPPLCVLTCTFILIHITSDMFYENTNNFFF